MRDGTAATAVAAVSAEFHVVECGNVHVWLSILHVVAVNTAVAVAAAAGAFSCFDDGSCKLQRNWLLH